MKKYRVLGIREFPYDNNEKDIHYPAVKLYLATDIVAERRDTAVSGWSTKELFCRAELAKGIVVDDIVVLWSEDRGNYSILEEIEKVGHVGE